MVRLLLPRPKQVRRGCNASHQAIAFHQSCGRPSGWGVTPPSWRWSFEARSTSEATRERGVRCNDLPTRSEPRGIKSTVR